MNKQSIQKILHFWFGNMENGHVSPEQTEIWWRKNPAIDEHIREHFQQDVLNAIAGEYEHCLEQPKSTLAVIILLDQFCRHIYRNTPQAFAADSLALHWAKRGIELQHDRHLNLFERTFFYIPFEHAEDLVTQQQAVLLFHNLYQEASPEQHPIFKGYYENAVQHKDIIARFSRFPHRNEILNRIHTHEEEKFLEGPNSRF
jgi:uncharacterized protein (DUF924 family)